MKEIIPSDIINILESDFSERTKEIEPVSQENLRFLAKLSKNIAQNDSGHYEMPYHLKKKDQSYQIIRRVPYTISTVLKGD